MLQRLHELETLVMGITGKLALWESLRTAPEVASLADLDDARGAGAEPARAGRDGAPGVRTRGLAPAAPAHARA